MVWVNDNYFEEYTYIDLFLFEKYKNPKVQMKKTCLPYICTYPCIQRNCQKSIYWFLLFFLTIELVYPIFDIFFLSPTWFQNHHIWISKRVLVILIFNHLLISFLVPLVTWLNINQLRLELKLFFSSFQ